MDAGAVLNPYVTLSSVIFAFASLAIACNRITILHWLFRDLLPERQWRAWLRWRYERETKAAKASGCRYYALGYGASCTCSECMERRHGPPPARQGRRTPPERQRRRIQMSVYDCGCPVGRTMDGTPVRQFHKEGCGHRLAHAPSAIINPDARENHMPFREGGVVTGPSITSPAGAVVPPGFTLTKGGFILRDHSTMSPGATIYR